MGFFRIHYCDIYFSWNDCQAFLFHTWPALGVCNLSGCTECITCHCCEGCYCPWRPGHLELSPWSYTWCPNLWEGSCTGATYNLWFIDKAILFCEWQCSLGNLLQCCLDTVVGSLGHYYHTAGHVNRRYTAQGSNSQPKASPNSTYNYRTRGEQTFQNFGLAGLQTFGK